MSPRVWRKTAGTLPKLSSYFQNVLNHQLGNWLCTETLVLLYLYIQPWWLPLGMYLYLKFCLCSSSVNCSSGHLLSVILSLMPSLSQGSVSGLWQGWRRSSAQRVEEVWVSLRQRPLGLPNALHRLHWRGLATVSQNYVHITIITFVKYLYYLYILYFILAVQTIISIVNMTPIDQRYKIKSFV